MDDSKLLRRDNQARGGNEVTWLVRECLHHLEFNNGQKRVEYLCIRIVEKSNKADTMVAACYRPPIQDQDVDKRLFKHLGEVSNNP